ncbi:MAG TPA: GNAT family N-acetyltransferase [Dehalococcoidia bacterium]|nr:GNAT family N-acetyltransferase [Dehalococcoidia bacterium]
MPKSPIELADVHLDLLYDRDEAGLLLRSRDPDVSAPLLHLLRTTEGNRWFLSAALSARERSKLVDALTAEPVIRDLGEMENRPPVLEGVRPLLATDRSRLKEERGPAFWFGEALPEALGTAEILGESAHVRTVPELSWIRATTARERPLSVARNSAGEVVAVCHSARSTVSAAEAGVETARDYRGRDLAGAVVVEWARAVLAEGRLPIYSTQWTNEPSLAVARKLGLTMFGEDYQIGG